MMPMDYTAPPISSRGLNDETRRILATSFARAYAELAGADEKPEPRFSLARAISEMSSHVSQGLKDGYEREICSATATMANEQFDPNRILIPLSALQTRDLTASSAIGGGFLVSTAVADGEPFDVLRPWSLTASAGLTVIPNLTSNVTISRVTVGSVAAWVANEGAAAVVGQPTLGQAAMTPKFASVVVNFSRQWRLQAAAGEQLLRQQLLGAVGAMLDQAILGGTGASGQPSGLHNTAGINTTSGTSFSHAGSLAMRRQVLAAGARQDMLRWIGTPLGQETLGARQRVTGGDRFIWDDNGILGAPAAATTYAPTGSLTLGDFSMAVLGIWGPPALRVEINPYQDFKAGIVAARVSLACDVCFPQPGAFSVAATVT